MDPSSPRLPSILLVDDSDLVRKNVQDALERGEPATIHSVASGTQAIQVLSQHRVDLILCDLEMPGLDGRKLLAYVRGSENHENVPFVMLTGNDNVDTKVEVLERGANDYLTKPFHDAELRARLKVHLQLKKLQDELAEKNHRLEKLTRTDPLTDVSNRRHLEKTMRVEMIRALRYKTTLTFLMIDVDHFKAVNDNHGHVVGDEVLRTVAARLSTGVRACDLVARYGGEEFCILLPQTDVDGGIAVAERYRDAIERDPIKTISGDVNVTASFGVVTFPHPQLHSLEEVVRAADDALYQAKTAGRNRVVPAKLRESLVAKAMPSSVNGNSLAPISAK